MQARTFLRHAAVYGLGAALAPAAGLVLRPVYARYLTDADFNALAILQRCAEAAATLMLIGGLRQAIMTFHQQSDGSAERERVVRTAFALLLIVCVGGGGILIALAEPVAAWLALGGMTLSVPLLRLALLGVTLEPLTLVPLVLLQARMESTAFVAVAAGQFAVRVGLCLWFVAGLGWGLAGVFLAAAITSGAFGTALCGRELLRGRGLPDSAKAVALVRFALPFLPGALCFFILQHGDRFFLWKWHEPSVGDYDLAYVAALAVGALTLGPLLQVWSAQMYMAARQADAPAIFGRMFSRILAAFLLVGLGVCLFQDEAVALLGWWKHPGAAVVIAPVVLAGFFQTAASLMDAGFYIRRRTGRKLVVTLVAAAAMTALYFLLIPGGGEVGAALATLGGFSLLAALTFWATRRLFPVRYEWRRLAAALGLAVGLWLASRALPPAVWTLPIKAALWLLWPLALWAVGLVSPAEKALLRGAATRALTICRPRQSAATSPRSAA
jgi:O-antigen/teichoic acid export membrane protein